MNIMYEIPSRADIEKVIITDQVVLKEAAPTYIARTGGGKRSSKSERAKNSEEKSA
jgi:ATP-dependent Clp protease ATP-binding subunit ClpX